jgi:hypothetical protein
VCITSKAAAAAGVQPTTLSYPSRRKSERALQAAAGAALGGDVGDVGGRPEMDKFVCYGVGCLGKKRQLRNKFSARMLTDVGTKDRKCEACVAAARSRHSGPSAADGFLCHGVRCRGKKRQPRLEFSRTRLRMGGHTRSAGPVPPLLTRLRWMEARPGTVVWHTRHLSVFVQLSSSIRSASGEFPISFRAVVLCRLAGMDSAG